MVYWSIPESLFLCEYLLNKCKRILNGMKKTLLMSLLLILGYIADAQQQPYDSSQSDSVALAPHAIPGIVEAEDFDKGGQGVSYKDFDLGISHGVLFRADAPDVEMENNGNDSGGRIVARILDGEWLEYTVNAASTGDFNIKLGVAVGNGTGLNRGFRLLIDNIVVSPDFVKYTTGNWHNAQDTSIWNVQTSIVAGDHVVRVEFYGTPGDAGAYVCNFDFLEFTSITPSASTLTWNGTDFSGRADHDTITALSDVIIDANYNDDGFACNDLTVNTGATLTVGAGVSFVVNGTLTNNGTIVVESSGSLVTLGTVTGTSYTVKRNTPFADNAGRYSFIGSPVSGFDIAGLGGSFHYTYQASDDSYQPASGTMTSGIGYTTASVQELVFDGAINTGTVSPTVSNAGLGYNLVGNPYPCAIDLVKFFTENTNLESSTIWIWDDGGSNSSQRTSSDFTTVNSLGTVGAGSGGTTSVLDVSVDDAQLFVGVAQGFIVDVASGTTISFTDDMKLSSHSYDTSFFRKGNDISRIKLQVSDISGNYSETLVGFASDASSSIDRKYDARNIALGDLQLFSMIETEEYAIQGVPSIFDAQKIQLGMDLSQNGAYTISASQLIDFPVGVTIDLIDKEKDLTVDLRKENYTFKSDIVQNSDRFSLLVGYGDLKSGILSVTAEAGEVRAFLSEDYGVVDVKVFDESGRLVAQQSNVSSIDGEMVFGAGLRANAMYILNITSNDEVIAGTKFVAR